jgi:hypothetical protein
MLEICIQTSYDQNVQLILKSYLPVVYGTPLNRIVKGYIQTHCQKNKKIKRADQILPEVYGTTLSSLVFVFPKTLNYLYFSEFVFEHT